MVGTPDASSFDPSALALLRSADHRVYALTTAERDRLDVVVLDGEVLGKPLGREEAAQMLRRLSGRRHTVVSGVTLRTPGRTHTFAAKSSVWFRPLADEEIAYYLDACRPYDKAGSYGIQEWIGYAAIEKINGSFYNVMGLPIQKVYTELDKFLK